MSYLLERKLRERAFQYEKKSGVRKQKLNVVPLEFALMLLTELSSHSIVWDAYEFEYRARMIESQESGKDFEDMSIKVPEKLKMYDRKKFETAASQMIREHDCNNGITWDTVDYYLNEYCLK